MTGVVVIGAGVAGLWASLELARRGIEVRLFDRAGPPGPHGCSWWAGGMLAPYCEGETADEVVVRHGLQAADAWAPLTTVHRRGSLVVTLQREHSELARFARRTGGHAILDLSALQVLEPDLVANGGQALFFASESHLNPREALSGLVAALATLNVRIEQAEVRADDFSGPVVDCRGFGARDRLGGLRAVRGEMLLLRAKDISLTRPVRLLHPRHPLYIVPRGDGVYMIGATQLESAQTGPVTVRSVMELLSAAFALDPRFGEAEMIETGADVRPAFADNVPALEADGNVLYLNGLFRHGFLMAPALASQAADFLQSGMRGDLFHEA